MIRQSGGLFGKRETRDFQGKKENVTSLENCTSLLSFRSNVANEHDTYDVEAMVHFI